MIAFQRSAGCSRRLSLIAAAPVSKVRRDLAALVQALDELALVARERQDHREQIAALGDECPDPVFRQGARTERREELAFQLGSIELHVLSL